MTDIGAIISFISTFWFIFPVMAVIMFYIYMSSQKSVRNRVLYIRRGNTMELTPCEIKGGSHVVFKPDKKSNPMTVQLRDKPYLYTAAGNMYRVYFVREGGGATVRPDTDAEMVINAENLLKLFFNQLPESVRVDIGEDKSKELVSNTLTISGIPIVEAENISFDDDTKVDEPTARAAASAVAMFERINEAIISNLPKGKAQWLMTVVYIVIGFIFGIGWGALIGKIWLFPGG